MGGRDGMGRDGNGWWMGMHGCLRRWGRGVRGCEGGRRAVTRDGDERWGGGGERTVVVVAVRG